MTEATPLASEQITRDTIADIIAKHVSAPPYRDVDLHLAHRDDQLTAADAILAALSATPAPSGQDASQAQDEVSKPSWSMEDYDAFVTFEGWLNEYRRSMDADVLHLWAADIVQSGKALLAIRDRVLAALSPAPGATAQDGVEDFTDADLHGALVHGFGQATADAVMPQVATPTIPAGMVAGLPDDWLYWLKDGARILRQNGTTTHADKADAIADALAAAPKQAEQQGVEEAREALQPFADKAEQFSAQPDGLVTIQMDFAHFRRAAKALATDPHQHGGKGA